MPSIIKKLESKGLIHPPGWLADNVHFECYVGSMAYGVSSDTSDLDCFGWAIPPRNLIFPHLSGIIPGFGYQGEKFDQFQKHHIMDEDAVAGKGRSYDIQVYSIVKYFTLCSQCNPTLIDSLFVPQECVLHMTQVGNMVRENRHLFLSKYCWPRFKGYALSQMHKMSCKEPTGKRKLIREKYGFDLKYGLHLVRLLYECEQLLTTGDLDIRRDREHLKTIRRGEVTEQEIKEWATAKEKQLEGLLHKSVLPEEPDEAKIKNLLLNCLEQHYGNLDKCVVQQDIESLALREVADVLRKYKLI
jgi:uncharacterized protein